MTDDELRSLVIKQFIALFQDTSFCSHIAPKVTCDEAEIIAAMIGLHGGSEAARVWLECHSDGEDDPDDEHHIPEVPDDVSGLEGPAA